MRWKCKKVDLCYSTCGGSSNSDCSMSASSDNVNKQAKCRAMRSQAIQMASYNIHGPASWTSIGGRLHGKCNRGEGIDLTKPC